MLGSSRSKTKAANIAASNKASIEETVEISEKKDVNTDSKENTSSAPSSSSEGNETLESTTKEHEKEKEQPKTKVCGTMEELQALFNKFKNIYLPELQSLYEDCSWLRVKLGLDTKKGKYTMRKLYSHVL